MGMKEKICVGMWSEVRENVLPTNLIDWLHVFWLKGFKASHICLPVPLYSNVYDLPYHVGEFMVHKRIGSIPKSLSYNNFNK